MWAFNSDTMHRKAILILALLTIGWAGCKKEKIYTYEVNDVTVDQEGAVKPNVKSDLEVISIAHTDLFGATIAPNKLEQLSTAYRSLGDKRLMIDMIILNFLNEPNVDIPTDAAMRADINSFVETVYRRLFVREPTSFERWFVSDLISKDSDITPDLVFYAFMTSNEYRYY